MQNDQSKRLPQITQVTYGRTINIGYYETVRFDLTAQVPEGENYRRVLNQLKDLADIEEERLRNEFSDR